MNHLTNLMTLNLSNNQIKYLSNMDGLINLQNLELQSNILSSIESIEELKNLPKLQVLDLKNNLIDEKDQLIPFFS